MRRNLMKEGFGNYITFTPEDEIPSKLEEQMLINNRIAQLLPFQLQYVDGVKQFHYCIDGARSLASIYGQQFIRYDQIVMLFENILNLMEQLKKYLLKAEGISLSPEDIYMLTGSETPYFCYLPGSRQYIMDDWKRLTEFLMNAIDHKEEQTVVFIYGLYRIVGEENSSITTISDYIKKQPKTEKPSKMVTAEPPSFFESPQQLQPVQREPEFVKSSTESIPVVPIPVKKIPWGKQQNLKRIMGIHIALLIVLLCLGSFFAVRIFVKEDSRIYFNNLTGVLFLMTAVGISLFGKLKKKQEKEIEEDMEATVLLSETTTAEKKSREIPYLRPVERTGEPYIPLEKIPLAIGYLREAVDIWIDDKSISRLHSYIEKKNGCYYISDLDSTNGTYINGVRLESKIQIKIKHQDHITFGNKEYEFLETML